MRRIGWIAGLSAAFVAASPAFAFDAERNARDSLRALERIAPAAPHGGRTIAALAIDDRIVTVTAYGRRARARAMDNVEDIRQARAMGKVFDGAPQPALLTVEISLKF